MTLGAWLVCAASAVLLLTFVFRLRTRSRACCAELQSAIDTPAAKLRRAAGPRPTAFAFGYGEPGSSSRLPRFRSLRALPRGRAPAVAQLAPHQDDQADRRSDRRRRLHGGTRFADHDRSYTLGMKDGKPFMTVAFGTRAAADVSRSTTRSARSAIRAICRRCPTAASTCCPRSGTSRRSGGSTGKRSRRFPTPRTTSGRSGTSTASTATAPTSSRASTSREDVQAVVDRDGHRLRSVPRPRPRARGDDGGVGEGPGVEAGLRQQLEEPAVEPGSQDLLDPQLGAAAHLRHVRVLPRQQDERVSSASRAAIGMPTTRCRS